MGLFAISGLLIGIACTPLGILTLVKGRRFYHYIWAFLSFSVALWGFGSFKIASTLNSEDVIFWWRLAYIGVILIPVLLVHFLHRFLDLSGKWFIKTIYFIAALFLFLDFYDGFFIKEVRFLYNEFYYLSSPPILYTVFVIFFVLLVIYSHIRLLQEYKKSNGIKKYQIKYLLVATTTGFSAGFLEFLPVYKIHIYPYLHFFIAFSPLVVAYAILRYRLMDIRIVTRKIFIYLISAAFTYGIFFFLAWTFNEYFGGVFTSTAYLAGLVIAPIFVAAFLWFFSFIQKIANKYFFFSLYNYQETINNLSQKLNYLNDLDEIINLIIDTVKGTVQLDRAGVLLVEENKGIVNYKIAKVIGFKEENGISLVQDNFLTKHLKETQKPLVKEELSLLARDSKNEEERKGFLELENNMKRIEASVCLSLTSSKKLIGIVVLGSKISGDAYTKEDLELLSTLAFQAGIAIDNARLYKEIQDFNKTLQQKVDEQTKEIKKSYEVEKKARKELERLNKAKSQFMLATQHHLRTPLTSMQGYLDLILGGTFGKIVNKTVKEKLARFRTSTKNLINIVEEILNISQFQLGRKVVSLEPNTEIEPILEEIISELLPEAEKKGIYLKLEKLEKLPKIKADAPKLKMAIFNIIDNAVKYTEKGGVIVKLEVTDSNLRIITRDTGIGIAKEETKNLFNKVFERGEKAEKLFATGRGIGLFIASKMVQAHKGKVWAESEGTGKGSTFYIELPIK